MNDRGRVPFALVGVLLLLTSTALVVSVVPQNDADTPDVDRAMEGATAVAVTELRGATDEAATDAAIDPVTDPSQTAAGDALNESQPFRDALRLRIYLRAVERLEGTEMTRGETTVRVSLPPVEPTTDGYREAIERVDIRRTGTDDAALRVEIDGVTLTASRDGRKITTAERSPAFVVANPALLLHDRTTRFEQRATAPVTQNGVGSRLTARLYPIAWARGYAQYGGAPITTVLGTRHVELATNDALLAEQRAVFGDSDPDGDRGIAAAGRRVSTTDVIAASGGEEDWQDAVLEGADEISSDPSADHPVGAWQDEPEDPMITVGVNASADHAFADLIGVDGDDELAGIIERAHTVVARITTSATLQDRTHRRDGSPGSNWTHVTTDEQESTTVRGATGQSPRSGGWRTVESNVFEVTITKTKTRTWVRGNETTTTVARRERSYQVGVAAQARTKRIDGVPDGRLTGELAGTTDRAVDRALESAGGFEYAARAAAQGLTVDATGTAKAEPTVDRTAVESELGTLRDGTQDVSVTLPATAVGTGRVNPTTRLREELSRDAFLGTAGRTPTERTIRAGRIAYLDALQSELRDREAADDATGDGIADALAEHLSADRLEGAMAAHREATAPDPEPLADPAGNLSLAVDTAPSYLTTRSVSRDRIDDRRDGSVYPLSTRTVNVFTSPHGQVASGIFDRLPLLNTERVSLSTAARTLAATHSKTDQDELRTEVNDATAVVRGALHAELVDAGVDEQEARALLESDASTADEALMLTNGTTIERISATDPGTVSADRLELRLQTELETVLKTDPARPKKEPTTAAQERIRNKYSGELEKTLATGIKTYGERKRTEKLGKRFGSLPAGLPIAPVPGYWYATANVWYVDVDGAYERFAVRSDRGTASGSVTYLRDGGAASVTHDGTEIHLGSADRVSVRTQTAVVVVVPPGPRGVGNTGGTIDERSPGWDS